MVREASQRDRRQPPGMAAPATTARANVNLALVKYWGKRDRALNLPATGSISLTLDGLSVAARRACRRARLGGRAACAAGLLGPSGRGGADLERAEGGLVARRHGARRDLALLPRLGRGRGGGPGRGAGGDPRARPGGPRPRRRAQRAQDARRRDGGAPAAPLLARRHRRLPRSGVEAPRRGHARLRDHRRRPAGEGVVRARRCAPCRRGAACRARGRARARLRAGGRCRGGGVRRVTASAPGRLFVTGEYAVLAGAPALLAAVDRRALLHLALEPGAGALEAESLAEGTRRVIHDPEREPLGGGDAGAVLAALRIVRAAAPSLAAMRAQVVVDTRTFLVDGEKLGLGRSAATVTAAVAAFLAGVGRHDRGEILEAALAAHALFQDG